MPFSRAGASPRVETKLRLVINSASRPVSSFGTLAKFSSTNHYMKAVLIVLLVLFGIIAIIGMWIAGIYNSLVALRNRFKNAFAQIDVQLKRRYDLIPNLVETAKGYLKHEHDTLEAVIKARNIAYTASQAAAANPADGNAM